MKHHFATPLLALLIGAVSAGRAEEVVIDFEQAEIGKPTPTWTEKGVVFELAGPLTQSNATGRIMFFPHLATNRKGILNAMATEQAIPVQATFPNSASAVVAPVSNVSRVDAIEAPSAVSAIMSAVAPGTACARTTDTRAPSADESADVIAKAFFGRVTRTSVGALDASAFAKG